MEEKETNMINVRVTFVGGYSYITPINGTLQQAKDYFLNKNINIGFMFDDVRKCIKVEEV